MEPESNGLRWDYRVFRVPKGDGHRYFISEAYYDAEGEFAGRFVDGYGTLLDRDSLAGLRGEYEAIARAFDRPVIELADDFRRHD